MPDTSSPKTPNKKRGRKTTTDIASSVKKKSKINEKPVIDDKQTTLYHYFAPASPPITPVGKSSITVVPDYNINKVVTPEGKVRLEIMENKDPNLQLLKNKLSKLSKHKISNTTSEQDNT